jgi:hypothetical protein
MGRQKSSSSSRPPPGANVKITPGGFVVVTPGRIELERGRSYELRFELDGYEPKLEKVVPQAAGATAGNLLLGGLVGLVMDQSSGAAFTLFPNPIHAHLSLSNSDADATKGSRLVFFNTSNSTWYADSGAISVEIDGAHFGTIQLGGQLEAKVEPGRHRFHVAHRDFWLFDDEYDLAVEPGITFLEVWARPMSTQFKKLSGTPKGFSWRPEGALVP